MKILLFGGSGQVGQEILTRSKDLRFEMVSPVVSELDITDREQVIYLARQIKPDLVLNCAAYTAVDKAEEEKDAAYRVNENGARYVAEAAAEAKARHIYISTDYIFDGLGSTPITEEAMPDPQNVYGASKLAGEKAVRDVLGDNVLVVRTSSVHGRAGDNIVHTILSLLEQRDQLQFIDDQIMSPTWAGWLAEALLDLVRMDVSGTVNACCKGEVSWCGFAREVLRLASGKLAGAERKRIDPVGAADYPRPAKRPPYSVLDTGKLEGWLGRPPIRWEDGLANHMKELGYE